MSVVFAMLCWAGAGIAVKEALVVFSPLTLIVLRFTLAIVLMLLVGLLFRGHEVLQAFAERQGVRIVNCTRGSMIDAYERQPMP